MKNIKSKFLSLLTAVFVLLPSIAVPVFADSSFAQVPLGSSSTTYAEMLQCGDYTGGGANIGDLYITAQTDDFVVAAVGSGVSTQWFVASKTAGAQFWTRTVSTNQPNGYQRNFQVPNTNPTSGGWYYWCQTISNSCNGSDWTCLVPVYSTLADAIIALDSWTPTPSQTNSLTIPRGYVCYIEIESSVSASIYTTMNDFSGVSLWGANIDMWRNDNRAYWFSNSYPVAGDELRPSNGAPFEWIASPSATYNSMHRTKDAYYELSVSSVSSKYLVILNPNLDQIGNQNDSLHIPYLTGWKSVKFFPLTLISTSTGIYSVSDSGFAKYDTASVTDLAEGESINSVLLDQDGNPSVLDPGGTSYSEPVETAADTIRSIGEVLEDFVKMVLDLLSKPVVHIQRLINGGSEFMHVLSGLFDWLPFEVSSMIVSALVVVVVIGVLKVLL